MSKIPEIEMTEVLKIDKWCVLNKLTKAELRLLVFTLLYDPKGFKSQSMKKQDIIFISQKNMGLWYV